MRSSRSPIANCAASLHDPGVKPRYVEQGIEQSLVARVIGMAAMISALRTSPPEGGDEHVGGLQAGAGRAGGGEEA
jgi:hypothetical protein